MFEVLTEHVEECRILSGCLGSEPNSGPNGAFLIRHPDGTLLQVIASNGMGWEHVSVAGVKRKGKGHFIPSWDIMCWVKDLFWPKDEWVVQFHPAEDEYVNNHPYVLHLFRPIGVDFPTPPSILVGLKKKRKRH